MPEWRNGTCPPLLRFMRWQAGTRTQLMNFYYTYVLACNDGKLYVGYSSNLQKRVAEHKSGKVPATQNRIPIKLVYYEACIDEKKAIEREKYLKTGFGRSFLKKRI